MNPLHFDPPLADLPAARLDRESMMAIRIALTRAPTRSERAGLEAIYDDFCDHLLTASAKRGVKARFDDLRLSGREAWGGAGHFSDGRASFAFLAEALTAFDGGAGLVGKVTFGALEEAPAAAAAPAVDVTGLRERFDDLVALDDAERRRDLMLGVVAEARFCGETDLGERLAAAFDRFCAYLAPARFDGYFGEVEGETQRWRKYGPGQDVQVRERLRQIRGFPARYDRSTELEWRQGKRRGFPTGHALRLRLDHADDAESPYGRLELRAPIAVLADPAAAERLSIAWAELFAILGADVGYISPAALTPPHYTHGGSFDLTLRGLNPVLAHMPQLEVPAFQEFNYLQVGMFSRHPWRGFEAARWCLFVGDALAAELDRAATDKAFEAVRALPGGAGLALRVEPAPPLEMNEARFQRYQAAWWALGPLQARLDPAALVDRTEDAMALCLVEHFRRYEAASLGDHLRAILGGAGYGPSLCRAAEAAAQGDAATALSLLRAALRLVPGARWGGSLPRRLRNAAFAWTQQGRYVEAFALAELLLAHSEVPDELYNDVLYLLFHQGDFERGARYADQFIAAGVDNDFLPHTAACLYVKTGELDKALACVRAAWESDYPHKAQLAADEDLAPLWEVPAFQAIVARGPGSETNTGKRKQ